VQHKIFALLAATKLRERRVQMNTLLSGAQLNVGHSYRALTECYRAISVSAVKCDRSRRLIEEVDGELKNYRATGRFETPALNYQADST
jgi:hypothetical protein